MSQEQVALDAGLDLSYVSNIECGKRNVSLTTMLKLARALNTSLTSLLDSVELQD